MRRSVLAFSAILALAPLASVREAHADIPPDGKELPAGETGAPQPPGFVSFCLHFPGQCATDRNEPKRLALTASSWQALETVNENVNRALRPVSDLEHYGRVEYWTIPTDGMGDCEDYALTKRQLLMQAGMPLRALRIAVARTWKGEEHAVLTVATDHGDYVLDNLTAMIRSWDDTGYEWIERQDPDHEWGWVSLEPPRS